MILRELERPFQLKDAEIPLKFTAGYVESPYAVPVPTLLRHANIALQHALDEREPIGLFNEEMLRLSQYGHLLEASLQGADTRGELSLLYQPIHNLQTGQWEAMEALLRWKHPTLGSVPPGTFIPVAERAGLIGTLGEWALRRAVQDARNAQQIAPLRVNVNVSPSSCSARTSPRVLEILRELNAPPTLLTLEVTESSVMQNVDLACRHLEDLRAAGVRIALDDFGSGHSSLALLADLPLDTVKLDRSFLRDSARGGTRGALLGSAIRLAGTWGCTPSPRVSRTRRCCRCCGTSSAAPRRATTSRGPNASRSCSADSRRSGHADGHPALTISGQSRQGGG